MIHIFPPEFEKFDFFSYNLYELNEPKIFGVKNKELEIYRLASVSFGGDISIITTIKNSTDNSIYKYVKQSKKRKILKKKISISNLDYNKFTTNLKSFKIQNSPNYINTNIDDGIQYALEVYKDGKYYAIVRNNPQTGNNRDLKFLEITELFYALK